MGSSLLFVRESLWLWVNWAVLTVRRSRARECSWFSNWRPVNPGPGESSILGSDYGSRAVLSASWTHGLRI